MRCLPLITAVAVAILCCGATCSRRSELPKAPEIVYVPIKETVDVPAELTADCEKVLKRNNSLAEAVRLANARDLANDECTARMRQIRKLGSAP